MSSRTRYYGMGFFDFGDPLGTDFSARVEIDRWLFLDKQIFGMMSVFGNGVIEGWEVSQTGALSVSISEGNGNINYMSARSTFPTEMYVPANTTSYVYARVVRSTAYTEEVAFIVSTSTIVNSDYILLAQVTTGPTSIASIDESVRREISFMTVINEAIAAHKHRGGSDNPTKIDLFSEVKGQLPGFRIADFDADKVTSGTFDLARLPLINHSDLQNVGMLTHQQLDTFVKTLESSNKELFGEIGSANLLQMIIAMKLLYDDSASAFYNSNGPIDKNFINEFAVIPGITPDSRIDFENTTAIVSLDNHYIEGQAASFGTSFYVRWEDALAWSTALSVLNVDVSGDSVTLAYDPTAGANITVLDSFDSGTPSFVYKDIPVKEGQYVYQGTGSTGSGAANLSPGAEHIYTFTWSFTEPRSLLEFTQFLIDVQCLTTDHGAINCFFMDSEAGELETMFEADAEHRTPDFDPPLVASQESTVGFETVIIDLTSLDQTSFSLGSVKSIVIWTLSDVLFTVDNMRVSQDTILPESGSFKLRYSTSTQVNFQRLEYNAVETGGSLVKVRTRASDGTALLNRSDWTQYLDEDEELGLAGTDLEIEVTLYANTARTVTPALNWIRLVVVTDADIDGFTIDTTEEFSRGDTTNITVDSATLSITSPVSVGSYYYAGSDKVIQTHYNDSVEPHRTDGENSIFATFAPIAPNQVFRTIETGERVTESQFYNSRSARRLKDKTYVVADTYNDRVLRLDSDGSLIEGFGSINYSHGSMTFPVSACIDSRTGILYVVWSRPVDFSGVSINGFTMINGGARIPLLVGYDLINNKKPEEISGSDRGQVMQIHLSEQNKAFVSAWPTTGCKLAVSGNVVPEGVGNSAFYRKLTSTGNIPLFIGNFIYVELGSPENIPLFAPTYAELNEWDTYLYTNGTVAVKEFAYEDSDFSGDPETVTQNAITFPTIVELDLSNPIGQKVVFSCEYLNFSPFIPGRATRLSADLILAGGLTKSGELKDADEGAFDFRNISGSEAQKTTQKSVLNDMFFDKTLLDAGTNYRGSVRTISTIEPSGFEIFQYESPNGLLVSDACLDTDPAATAEFFVAAESCFVGQSGRIIKIDNDGNIVYSYGEGTFGLINDVEMQDDGAMVITS